MDKYEEFISEIIDATEREEISWGISNRSKYAEYVHYTESILRSFSANYNKKNKEYTLVLIEKKMPTFSDIIDNYIDKPSFELLVLLEENLLFNFDERYVEKARLLYLSDLIAEKISDVNELFS